MRFWAKTLAALFVAAVCLYGAKESAVEATKKGELEANITFIVSKMASLEENGSKNIWKKKFDDYKTYKSLQNELSEIRERKSYIRHTRGDEGDDKIAELGKKEDALKKRALILGDFKKSIFGDLTKVEDPGIPPKVDSPIGIFQAFSFIKELTVKKEEYETKLSELDKLVETTTQKNKLSAALEDSYEKLKDSNKTAILAELRHKNDEDKVSLRELKAERDAFAGAAEAYKAKSSETIQKLQIDIKYQLVKLLNIAITITVIIAVSALVRWMIKKYSADHHERAYLLGKSVNIVTVILILLTLLFSYINNVGYVITILGFASAGIAIAMKDWFMSVLGWMTIIIGGSIKVGDRVKISSKEGVEILGDIIDISILTITLYEEVSLISYEKNKRAGRIVFVPNNYIFTHIFLNYSHSGLTTVWDNVNIPVTFDSDLDAALSKAYEIASKNTRTFSKLTDRAIKRMRTKYSIGDVPTEPRVFSMMESNGVVISIWYPAHSFAILKTKSQMTKELVEAFRVLEGVKIAYPTNTVVLQGERCD